MKRDFCDTCRWFERERDPLMPGFGVCHFLPPRLTSACTHCSFPPVLPEDFCSAHAPVEPEPVPVEGVLVDALQESNEVAAEDWRDRLGLRGAVG